MRSKGCLIALGVALALGAMAVALLGPRVAREGLRFYAPISKIRAAGEGFDKWVRENPWEDPKTPVLEETRLIQFLALRKELQALGEEAAAQTARFDQREKPTFRDVPEIVEGMGGVVAKELDALRRAGITPGEYRYLDRLIYRTWLRALRSQGKDPLACEAAAEEIEKSAAGERDPVLAKRLRKLAEETRQRKPAAPEGTSPEIHALLLAHAPQIQALADATPPLALQRRR